MRPILQTIRTSSDFGYFRVTFNNKGHFRVGRDDKSKTTFNCN